MKKTNRSVLHSQVITFKPQKQIKATTSTRLLAALMIVMMMPLFILNAIMALIKDEDILQVVKKRDALSRTVVFHYFTHGLFCKSAMLLTIARGHLCFCGVPLTHSLTRAQQHNILNQFSVVAGVFSLFDLHKSSGLAIANEEQLLLQQLNASFLQRVALVIKSLGCLCFYSHDDNLDISADNITLFGLNITNIPMLAAVNWTIKAPHQQAPNVGFYVNAHSINLGIKNPSFMNQLRQADALFADGSGMRLAAKHAGQQLKDNNNGTDMLPHLCARCIKHSKSIFMLGAKPGVAMQAAINLKKRYPALNIVGVQHGFFDPDNVDTVITHINNSGCDILLVAMGSPMQESWILTHRRALKCQTALAVGGLFDFYAGNIARSPMWLRELGLEWVWRLIQEPKTKFYRYVVGNPIFLFRLYCLGLATKGEK